MYARARELHVAFMAGSSVRVTCRRPPLRVERKVQLVEAVQIGYGPFEGYGFHALEGLQCLAERRRGGETGVRSVQCLTGAEMWRALEKGLLSRALFSAALAPPPAPAQAGYRPTSTTAPDACG